MRISSVISAIILVSGIILSNCAPGGENVVPELILDVPDEIKPAIAGIMLRIQADNIYPFEIDLADSERELIIPSGKDRAIHALVTDAEGGLIASGMTVCTISSINPKIKIILAVPPAAPELSVSMGPDGNTIVRWSRYTPAADSVSFAMYQLYRSPVAEVSQIADLAATVTNAADTVFTEGGPEGAGGYYRVYVYEKSGAFNGSAAVRAGTVNTPDSEAL